MIKIEDLLPQITEEVVLDIMKENGSDLYNTTIDNKTKQKCLWFKTICHGGDSHKLCFFTETKDFFCYTNCGRMTFFNFIKEIRNATNEEFYEKVILYVANKIGYKKERKRFGFTSKLSKQIIQDFRDIEEAVAIKESQFKDITEITNFYDDTILNYFNKDLFHESWINDGISIDSMKKFGISWYEIKNSIIIPHYNIDNKLVGIRRRSFRPEDSKNKYMPLYIEGKLYDHPLALNLYGLNKNIEAIKSQKKAIIVEGEKSVLLSDTYFGNDSITVATCGFNISGWQINTLLKYVNEVYLAFDKDFDVKKEWEYQKDKEVYKDFLKYKKRLNSLVEKFNGRCKVRLIKDNKGLLDIKDSPFDKGKETFEKLFKNAKVI